MLSRVVSPRPDLDAELKQAHALAAQLAGETSAASVRQIILELDALRARVDGPRSRAWLAHQRDLFDEAARAEVEFWNEAEAVVHEIDAVFWRAVAAREDAVRGEFGEQILCIGKAKRVARSGSAAQLLPEIAAQRTSISQLLSVPVCEVEGDNFSAVGVRKLFRHASRDVRRRAWEVREAFCETKGTEIDASFDRLQTLRFERSRALGFESYLDLAYLEECKVHHTRDELTRFRTAVREAIVPLCEEVLAWNADRLGLGDPLLIYDEEVTSAPGSAAPLGGLSWFTSAVTRVCGQLHPEINDFIADITEYRMLDLEPRRGKTQAGFCMFVPDRRMPYIMATYGGYPRDVDTIVHELGHGFHQYAARNQPLLEYASADDELAELCAMGMTVLTLPWMDQILGSASREAKSEVVWGLVRTIPFVTMLDHFEHEVFSNRDLSGAERCELWRTLEQEYLPWRNYGPTMPRFQAGAGWQLYADTRPLNSSAHGIAAGAALQLLATSASDHPRAVDAYVRMCKAGGSLGFAEVLELGGLQSPFASGVLERLASELRPVLLGARGEGGG